MNNNKWDYLYKGLAYEHFLIAELYDLGFEGQKIPADFGFDILATNVMQNTFKNSEHKTFLFQVKMRNIDFTNSNIITTYVAMKKDDFNYLINDNRALLRTYLVYPNKNYTGFWLSSLHLKYLFSNHFIKCHQEKYYINIQIDNNGDLYLFRDDRRYLLGKDLSLFQNFIYYYQHEIAISDSDIFLIKQNQLL